MKAATKVKTRRHTEEMECLLWRLVGCHMELSDDSDDGSSSNDYDDDDPPAVDALPHLIKYFYRILSYFPIETASFGCLMIAYATIMPDITRLGACVAWI